MAFLINDILPPEERLVMGLSLQRMNIDYSVEQSDGNTYTFVLVQEPGQNFLYETVDFRDGICPLIELHIGSLYIVAALTAWKKIITDIGGKSIYTVTLVQYASIFLKPITITEAFHVPPNFVARGAVVDASGILQEPFIHQNTVWISTTEIDGNVLGPSMVSIFESFENKIFFMGENSVFYDFDGLLVDSDAPDLIEMQEGMTLFDAIKSYATDNNFRYNLVFTFMGIENGRKLFKISFRKIDVIDENSTLAQGYLNVFDALMATHEGEIINAEQGYSVAKDFKQDAEYVTMVNLDEHGHPESYETDTEIIVHTGILGVANFGEKTPITVVRGGLVSDFLQFTKGDINQFWGFESPGVLRGPPNGTDLAKMDKILNNEALMEEDIHLREYMNFWGRQFVVDSTHLTEILPYTLEQLEAIAQEEQAMIDLLEALLEYFNAIPPRTRYINGMTKFDEFVSQYNTDHPEIYDGAGTSLIQDGLLDFIDSFKEGSQEVVLGPEPASLMETFETAVNAHIPQYPSVDEMLVVLENKNKGGDGEGLRIRLESTQISLEKSRAVVQIPASVQVAEMCFPAGDHPLIGAGTAAGNFRSSTGLWPSYVELPKIPKSDNKTSYGWGAKISSTINNREVDKKQYVRVEANQYNNYYIITLPGQLLKISKSKSSLASVPVNPDILEIKEALQRAFIASKDTKRRYGPYIVKDGRILDGNSQEFIDIVSDSSKYVIRNVIREDLVPESFSNNGTLTKNESIEEMKKFIVRNYQSLNQSLVWAHRFGSLTVNGLPVEEAYSSIIFPDRATITRLSVNFGLDGVRTTYYVDSPDREDLDPVKVKQPIPKEEPDKPKDEQVQILEPKLESDPKQNTFSDAEKQYVARQKTGGRGMIEGGSAGYYNVVRINDSYGNPFSTNAQYAPTQWSDVRNLCEPNSTFTLLHPGRIVTVDIFAEEGNPSGPFDPFMEVVPAQSVPGYIAGGGGGNGPIYDVGIFFNTDPDQIWGIGGIGGVMNVQEFQNGPGRLEIGTLVSVELYNNGEDFYISQEAAVFTFPEEGITEE